MDGFQEKFNIEQEYSKNKVLKPDDIKILRQWVETKTPYNDETSDFLLFLCLHSCYYDVDRTKKTISSYHNLRAGWPEIFKNRNPRNIQFSSQLDVAVQWPLKQTTRKDYKIIFIKVMDPDASKYDAPGQVKLFFTVIDYWLTEIKESEGVVVIFDNNGNSLKHLLHYSLETIRKVVAYVQDAFPIRLKSIHFINTNYLVDRIIFLVKIFMDKEFSKKFHVHTNMETLYEFVPKNCLPKDYGGQDVTIQTLQENMKATLLANYKLFLEEGEEDLYNANDGDNENGLEWEESEDTVDIRL